MIYLNLEQIIRLHKYLITQTGGLYGIRDTNLLNSCVNSPLSTFDGIDLYQSIEEKASWLAFSLIKNHCFIDGNKRIGIYAMLVFLEVNGIKLLYSQEEIVIIALDVAQNKITHHGIVKFINEHKI